MQRLPGWFKQRDNRMYPVLAPPHRTPAMPMRVFLRMRMQEFAPHSCSVRAKVAAPSLQPSSACQ